MTKEYGVYAIYTRNKDGNIDGVYVGSSRDVNTRLKSHLSETKTKNPNQLHLYMRENGFFFQILSGPHECGYGQSGLRCTEEYQWIKFFETQTELNIHNKHTAKGAELPTISIPGNEIVFTEKGVAFRPVLYTEEDIKEMKQCIA